MSNPKLLHLYHVIHPVVALVLVVIRPTCRTNEIGTFAHFVDPTHAWHLDRFLIADPYENGGALEEESLGVHLEYLKTEFVVVHN